MQGLDWWLLELFNSKWPRNLHLAPNNAVSLVRLRRTGFPFHGHIAVATPQPQLSSPLSDQTSNFGHQLGISKLHRVPEFAIVIAEPLLDVGGHDRDVLCRRWSMAIICCCNCVTEVVPSGSGCAAWRRANRCSPSATSSSCTALCVRALSTGSLNPFSWREKKQRACSHSLIPAPLWFWLERPWCCPHRELQSLPRASSPRLQRRRKPTLVRGWACTLEEDTAGLGWRGLRRLLLARTTNSFPLSDGTLWVDNSLRGMSLTDQERKRNLLAHAQAMNLIQMDCCWT